MSRTSDPVLPRFDPPADIELGRPFWDAVERGELALPQCAMCGAWHWYPDDGGTNCPGGELTWVPVAGTGSVYTFTRVHRSFLPGGRDDVPYVVGFVELDGVEGPRLVANVDDTPGLVIGARVRVRFERVGGRAHPVFELA
jgi:uncharacterized OB-fold protein